MFDTVVRMLTIKGSYVGNRLDTQEAIDFFARGLISAPYKVAKLSELPEIFEKMGKGQITGRYVLDMRAILPPPLPSREISVADSEAGVKAVGWSEVRIVAVYLGGCVFVSLPHAIMIIVL